MSVAYNNFIGASKKRGDTIILRMYTSTTIHALELAIEQSCGGVSGLRYPFILPNHISLIDFELVLPCGRTTSANKYPGSGELTKYANLRALSNTVFWDDDDKEMAWVSLKCILTPSMNALQ